MSRRPVPRAVAGAGAGAGAGARRLGRMGGKRADLEGAVAVEGACEIP